MPNEHVLKKNMRCTVCAGDGCEVLVVIGERIQPDVEYRARTGDQRTGTYFCKDCKGKA